MSKNLKYYNRDLSWLRFNARVLQEAADKRNPLYERLKFLAIFSANLDEFFKVRVSNIRRIKSLDQNLRKKLITKPNRLLRKIKAEVHNQQEEFGRIYRKELIPALDEKGIKLVRFEDYNDEQKDFTVSYFEQHIADKVTTKSDVNDQLTEIFIENEKLYLVGLANGKLLITNIPDDSDRFVTMKMQEGGHRITYVDDIIKQQIQSTYETSSYAIKVSRDAELYLNDEFSGNLLEKIKLSLSRRDTGQVTRILVDMKMPEELLNKLMSLLDINETDVVLGGRYHNFKDFFSFPNPTQLRLSHKSLPPIKQKAIDKYKNIFKAISKKDRLLYFPYESFDTVIDLIESAAEDAKVDKIKMTLYRVSKDSAVANALLKAVKNGKEVTVFIETKARFDESNNIKWGQTLEENGAKVIYSYPGIKVHSKIMYIERIEGKKNKAYAYIGTGNFNEKTARIYTDYGLMTAAKEITSELLQVFQVLEMKLIVPKTKKLLVSPFSARSKFEALIEKEITNAQAGKEATILLKLNSLEDRKLINLLYKASNAGVKIRLIVRGICCLVPDVKGQSKNISVISIVDRFLEHARVYIFGNAGKEKMYIGSADWMTRNLDHRIEVITPILDKDIFKRIKRDIQLQVDDKVKARIVDKNQVNKYVSQSSKGLSSQNLTYKLMSK